MSSVIVFFLEMSFIEIFYKTVNFYSQKMKYVSNQEIPEISFKPYKNFVKFFRRRIHEKSAEILRLSALYAIIGL